MKDLDNINVVNDGFPEVTKTVPSKVQPSTTTTTTTSIQVEPEKKKKKHHDKKKDKKQKHREEKERKKKEKKKREGRSFLSENQRASLVNGWRKL